MAEIGDNTDGAPVGGRGPARGLVRAAVDDVQRFTFIARVLIKHGFSEMLGRTGVKAPEDAGSSDERVDPRADPGDTARRFRMVLEELGPTFVKVGQILSTRPDVLPPPFIAELSRLQDNAAPVAFDAIKTSVEAALGDDLSVLYSAFEPEPLASASMAQTHRATLPDGTDVVVKVQRPGIAETMRSDLDLMHLFARLLEATVREMELYAPGDIVRVLDEALSHELDFEHEAANLRLFAELLEPDARFVVPTLYPEHSCRSVLTMSRIVGRKPDQIEPGSDEGEAVALTLIEGLYRQIFRYGFFHGDPHPGNLFVLDDGRVALIDFGLCGHLDPLQRDQLVALIVAVISGDIDGIARSLLRMGRPLGHISMARFKDEVASIRHRHLKRNLAHVDATAFLEECIDAAQRHRVRIAIEYSILSKSAVTLEGVIRQLAPELDLVRHVEPYGRRLITEHYSAERLMKASVAGAMHLGTFLREVPEQLGQVLMDVESGHLRVIAENDGLTHLGRELNLQTTRMIMGAFAVALMIATPLWLANEPLRIWHDRIPVMTTLTALSAATFAFWALAWHIVGGRVQRKLRLTPWIKLLRGRFFR